MTQELKEFTEDWYDKEIDWLGGFFDAEGFIGTVVKKDENRRINFGLTPSCQIRRAYVAGYFDGEGCVVGNIFKVKGSRRKFPFEIQPNIRCSSTDFDILQKTHDFLETHGLDVKLYHSNKKRPEESDQQHLVIYGLENVRKFLELIVPYLKTEKKMQGMIMLKEILPRMKNGEHLTKEGFIRVVAYIEIMDSLKKGWQRSKYTVKYFRKLWGINSG